jgi:hypothetical protein
MRFFPSASVIGLAFFTISAFAAEIPFRSEDPIGRLLTATLEKAPVNFGYFCLVREMNSAGASTCTRSQFARSTGGEVAHDLMGNLTGGEWTTVGPVFSPDTIDAFVATLRTDPQSAAIFDRIWAAIWDRSEDWQFKPKAISAKDFSDFTRALGSETANASADADDPVARAKRNFVGWWESPSMEWLFRIGLDSSGGLTMKVYALVYGLPRSRADRFLDLAESRGTLGFRVSEKFAWVNFRGTEGHDEWVAIPIDADGLIAMNFGFGLDPDHARGVQPSRKLTDAEVKRGYKIRD